MDAGPEWPDGAAERVLFRREDFRGTVDDLLPYTEYYGKDGWPVHCPESVKSRLDPRAKAELHSFPWTARPEEWDATCWLTEFSDYDRFLRWNRQAALVQGGLQELALPEPQSCS